MILIYIYIYIYKIDLTYFFDLAHDDFANFMVYFKFYTHDHLITTDIQKARLEPSKT